MLFNLPVTTQDFSKPVIAVIQKVEVKADKPVEYIVKENDSLAKIAKDQNTNIDRLWQKNTQLENPDIIKPGDKLEIPKPDETLAPRPLPIPEPVIIQTPATYRSQNVDPPTKHMQVAGTKGNTYSRGFCTWYVKNLRPDLPNNLGNANTWYSRAASQGFAVGSTPRVGAVAAAVGYMHVALVVGINGDGTIQITEMNYKGWNVASSRKAPVSEFRYIY